MTTQFFNLVHEEIQKMEALMRAQGDSSNPDLRAALELLLTAGGKRIRPTVTLLTGKMLGAPIDKLITLGAAVELLHTATLVHDDLIDGALLRRGSPTLNSQWSPSATILTGDFIFSRSAKLAAETNSVELMKIFTQTLTTIVNGEITQLFSSRCQLNRENYYQRIYAKTASLFETSTRTAALLSPADNQVIEEMRSYGYNIGMAFQIIDDILDLTGEQATLGKPVGSDLRQGIITLPVYFYTDNHPDDEVVGRLISGECLDAEQAEYLVNCVRHNSAISLAYDEAARYINKAQNVLDRQPDNPERHGLAQLANYIIERRL